MKTKTTKPHTGIKKQQIQMKVWACTIDTFNYSEYQIVNTKDQEFFDKICIPEMIKGHALKDFWKPLVFMKKRQRKHTDFTVIGGAGIVMSKKAVETLLPFIQNSVEILPLKTMARAPFFFVNVLESLDALDEEKTTFQYSSVSKTKIGVEKFVFDPEKITNKHMFKIKGFWYNTFLSDEFRTACKTNQLQGLDFTQKKLLWKHAKSMKKADPRSTSNEWDDF